MSFGIICRSDLTGLGNQSKNLVRMLQPDRLMLVDSTPFNGNKQYFENYSGYNTKIVRGFPNNIEVLQFINGLDAVLTCELFYNNDFVRLANNRGVRTYNQYNYEFLDNLSNPWLELPTKLLSPSYWYFNDMKAQYGDRVVYLPPPIISEEFGSVLEYNLNLNTKPRFLHVVGRMAVNDRNGTLDLLQSIQYCKEDFELVLKVQKSFTELKMFERDSRIIIDTSSPEKEVDLYKGFHAMILPRRYAGLCLPMNEALSAGLPVIMTDISPNNYILPKDWLVESSFAGQFQARLPIDYYSANHKKLAKTIDNFAKNIYNNKHKKEQEIAVKLSQQFSDSFLLEKYKEVIV